MLFFQILCKRALITWLIFASFQHHLYQEKSHLSSKKGQKAQKKITDLYTFFSASVFFHRHWQFTGQQGKGGGHVLFFSVTSTRSRTFRHLCATLQVRWLLYIFNRIAFNYQAAIQWDLPPYRVTLWLIDNTVLISVFILDDLILGFCYSSLTRETDGFELVLQPNQLTM